MSKRFFVKSLGALVVVSLLIGFSQCTLAQEASRKFQRQVNSNLRIRLQNMEMEMSAGTSEGELTLDELDEPDFTGIQVPFGFRPVSKTYRFGPHGMKFNAGMGPKVQIIIDPTFTKKNKDISKVKLYYINRDDKKLDIVDGQSIDTKHRVIEARLIHFSDYVLGFVGNWDGTGLSPFVDYINQGDENVCTDTNLTSVVSTVIDLKGRGLNTKLERVFAPTGISKSYEYYTCPLTIQYPWRWSLTCYYVDTSGNFSLYLPGGACYSWGKVISNYVLNGRTFNVYNSQGIYYSAPASAPFDVVYLNDGTKLSLSGNTETITDPNGNQITINFKIFSLPYTYYTTETHHWGGKDGGDTVVNVANTGYISVPRIEKLIDSIGRTFYFRTDAYGDFTKLEQQLSDNKLKQIIAFVKNTDVDIFIDSLGKTTTYSYQTEKGAYRNYEWSTLGISKVVYSNGTHSEYSVSSDSTGRDHYKTQKFFRSKENTPFKTVVYHYNNQKNTPDVNIVNDGQHIIRYEYCNTSGYEFLTSYQHIYDISGKLLKRVTNSWDLNLIRNVAETTDLIKNDGSIGSTATYNYSYDNWGNPTKIIDPYGTQTVMAYANTNSRKELSTKDCTGIRYVYDSDGNQVFDGYWSYNDPSDGYSYWEFIYYRDDDGNLIPVTETYTYQVPNDYPYQNALYNSGYTLAAGFDKLLTKATIIHDPIHNKDQLKQIHYQYDAKGNLLKSSEVYNGDYLNTDYTYDQYGNVVTITDANRNTIKFEYRGDAPYNSAFLTRVYKVDNTTIATYDYDTALGLKTMATDPKGNVYRYTYDPLGRLTSGQLDR